MSPFCEVLMDATDGLPQPMMTRDAALVLCTDGKMLATRKYGIYPNALRMLLYAMLNDEKMAELVLEAGVLYAEKIPRNDKTNQQTANVPFKYDTPIDNK